jgi:hypothetical protein
MGVQITDSAHVALYCNTVDKPLPLPLFDSRDHAADFLAWAHLRGLGDVRDLNVATGELAFLAWRSERTDEEGFLRDEDQPERTP